MVISSSPFTVYLVLQYVTQYELLNQTYKAEVSNLGKGSKVEYNGIK